MATATPSPLASSVEKTNGNKLSRLLIDGGTTVLKNVFDHYKPPANLAANLSSKHIHSILTKLRHRKILNDSQWDKLFPPPGGGPASSINFDITLLFLLLRNICGLHPPSSGWDRMPPVSDTSFEANLARIKYYRNVLYGHVTTTGIQTSVFDVKWQEISSVLVSLGLSQFEVDRLKREPCGEDYVSAVTEWTKNDEEIQFQLKDICTKQLQVLQTHKEDHKTLQDTHQTVGRLEQTLQDTHQAVGNLQQTQTEAVKLQQEDHRILQNTRHAVQGVQRLVQDAKEMLGEVQRTQQESRQQIKYETANTEERREKAEEDRVLKKLAKVNTERVIQYHSGKYQEETRLLIFEKIRLWRDDRTSENRVIVVSGDAGMGKSVIAAVVCQRMQHAGQLSGSHFCQHNKERYRNPKVMLQSLACQLCDVLPEYKSELVMKLSRNIGVDMNNLEVQELFEFLFEEPLCSVGDPGRNLLLVIDGLDESEYKGRNDLLDVVANHFCKLPVWFRFLVTTRPEVNIAGRLKKFNPIQLEQDNEENVKDIRLFLEKQLSGVIQAGCNEVIIDALVQKAAGHFLYAYLMVDFIKENVSLLTPEELGRILPSGVSSVYQSYFHRLEKELEIGEDQFLTFLSAMAAAREPLPQDFVSQMLRSDAKASSGPRKVTKAIDSISTLLPVHDDCIVFFHKSVKDWLTDRTAYGRHNFSVDENQGHVMLSQLCTNELNNVKRKGVHGTEFSDTARYALQHGVYHMLEVKESTRSFEEIVNNYVTDLEIVYAKLCVNNTASSEDIVLTQKQEAFQSLNSERREALGTLLSLSRKYRGRLSTHPSIIFQVIVNEGGDVLAGEATKVLQSREIPYMEYLQKEALKELNKTQAEFPCKSAVACFDVSPKQEFMVCECTDGMIYLWSLKTGEQRWVRPIEVKKFYRKPSRPFRVMPNSNVYSCYRSVVFHPTEPIVLPGVLSYAYSFKGKLQSLFPRSNCTFSVCSVYGDESKIITDCPGDAKCLVMWNLKNGEEITRTIRNEDVLSFAWSPDGTLLAISHFSGLVCLVDALNCLETTLAEVAADQPCGLIKFTPDIQFLSCYSWSSLQSEDKRNDGVLIKGLEPLRFRLNVIKLPCGTFSLNVLDNEFGQNPWNYESSSKGGFLMGDPMLFRFSWHVSLELFAFAFVLNKQSVLRVLPGNSKITMLKDERYSRATWRSPFFSRTCRIAFALDGKTIYCTTNNLRVGSQVVSLDVSSGDRKALEVVLPLNVLIVPVSEGVVLKQGEAGADVQLWNFELSQQIRSWPNLSEVRDITPVSDQCVACVGRDFEVSILNTSNGNIEKTIPLRHEEYLSIVCNSKYQLLSTTCSSVQLLDGENEIWKRTVKLPTMKWTNSIVLGLPGMFSPTEEFVLFSSTNSKSETEVLVLEASSGKLLRTLCTVDRILGCAFVSKTECVISCRNSSESYFCLPLFNVCTGDVLTVLDIDFIPSRSLASCPQKGLIAIGIKYSKNMCTVIEVKLPRDKANREAKVSEISTLGDKGCATRRRPGNEFHAYSIDGDLLPLFPESSCRFSVCSVHGDESKIITDCPGDAKRLVMWNLKNGEEISRTIRNEDVLSFAWSPDGTLLAISHFSGLVCLVDALNCLDTTLAEVATNQPCGMIRFSPDIQFLFCLSWPILPSKDKPNELRTLIFPLNVVTLPCGTFSLNVLDNDCGRNRWNYESSCKCGFLMGDPMVYWISSHVPLESFAFAFVLNEQSVLRVFPGNRNITMLGRKNYLYQTWECSPFFSGPCRIAFALDGKTIYRTTEWYKALQVVSLDVSSGDRKAEKVINARDVLLVPVSEGVLLKETEPRADVQLWNFELSQIVRSWPNLSKVMDIMPVSDQCVACVWENVEVSILDTSNGNIVKTIPLCHEKYRSIVCSSKYQLLSIDHSSVQLSDGKNKLWKATLHFPHFFRRDPPGMFSPTEEFVLISFENSPSKKEVLVLKASSGKYLRTLCTVDSILDCAFVSETECVIVCKNTSGSYCLQLFNVSTGDFLTVLDVDFVPSKCLASCPQKGLIALGIEDSDFVCVVIQVKLPRDKANREVNVSESSTLGDKGTLRRPGNKFLKLQH